MGLTILTGVAAGAGEGDATVGGVGVDAAADLPARSRMSTASPSGLENLMPAVFLAGWNSTAFPRRLAPPGEDGAGPPACGPPPYDGCWWCADGENGADCELKFDGRENECACGGGVGEGALTDEDEFWVRLAGRCCGVEGAADCWALDGEGEGDERGTLAAPRGESGICCCCCCCCCWC